MSDELLKELRHLTVAHQTPGECKWCDNRFAKIEAVLRGMDRGYMS